MSARRVWWLVSESGSERSNEMKRTIKTLTLASLVAAVVGAGVVYSGVINVGADDPHFPAIHALLNTARERSIAVRARDVEVPNLADEKMIRSGAGNYNSMCIGCHLAPGVSETELSQSLYPAPPDLSKVGANGNPAATFWIIKHGIKASGMPAWGKRGAMSIYGEWWPSWSSCRSLMRRNIKHWWRAAPVTSMAVAKP